MHTHTRHVYMKEIEGLKLSEYVIGNTEYLFGCSDDKQLILNVEKKLKDEGYTTLITVLPNEVYCLEGARERGRN
jgi:hypothetical protein